MRLLKNITVSFCVVFLLSIIVVGQEKQRLLEKRVTKNDPVELINFEIKNRVFNDKKTIVGDRFWLRDLRINVRNFSNKPIIYLKVSLEIEPQGEMRAPFILPLIFGSYGIPSKNNPNQLEVIPPLLPNQTIKLGIAPDIYERFINSVLSENQIDNIAKVRYYFDFVVFDDGTGWQRGKMMRRNPNNPQIWDHIPNTQQISYDIKETFSLTPFLEKISYRENYFMSSFQPENSFFLQNTRNLITKI